MRTHRRSPNDAIARMTARERARFAASNPKSAALAEPKRSARCSAACRCIGWPIGRRRSRSSWPRRTAPASRMSTAHDYVDFCLGDTGAMFGHSPEPVAEADPRTSRARLHDDAAQRRRSLGRRRTRAPLRLAVLASRRDRDRRQPLRAALGARAHRPRQNPGLRRLLSRHGRRNDGAPEGRQDRRAPRPTRRRRRRCAHDRASWNSTTSPRSNAPSRPATSPPSSPNPR